MPSPSIENVKRAATQWLHARWSESSRCRDCQSQVYPLDTVCSGCGLANPAQVHLSPLVWTGVALVGVAIVGIAVML